MQIDVKEINREDLEFPGESRIMREVMGYYQISAKDLISPCRKRHLFHARMMCIALMREAGTTLVTIGNVLGKRHHSTIIHGLQSFKKMYVTERWVKTDFEVLKSKFRWS